MKKHNYRTIAITAAVFLLGAAAGVYTWITFADSHKDHAVEYASAANSPEDLSAVSPTPAPSESAKPTGSFPPGAPRYEHKEWGASFDFPQEWFGRFAISTKDGELSVLYFTPEKKQIELLQVKAASRAQWDKTSADNPSLQKLGERDGVVFYGAVGKPSAGEANLAAADTERIQRMRGEASQVFASFQFVSDRSDAFYKLMAAATSSPTPHTAAPSPVKTTAPSPSILPKLPNLSNGNRYEVKWTLSKPGATMYVGKDDTLYFISGRGMLLAYDRNGKLKWEHMAAAPLAGGFYGEPQIKFSPAGDIYVMVKKEEASPYELIVFSPDGSLSGSLTIPKVTSWAVDRDHNVSVTHKDGLSIYDAAGKLTWTVSDSSMNGTLDASPDGGWYVMTENRLIKLDASGKMLWTYGNWTSARPLRYTPEKDPLVLSKEGWVRVDRQNGQAREEITVDKIFMYNSVCTDKPAAGCYAQYDHVGAAWLDAAGKLLWTFNPIERKYGGTKAFVLDPAGNVAFANDGGNIYSFDTERKPRFTVIVNSEDFVNTELAFLSDGTLVVLPTNGDIYAIGAKP